MCLFARRVLFSPVENEKRVWQSLLSDALHAYGEIERRTMLSILNTSHATPIGLFDLNSPSERPPEIVAEQCEEGGHADFLDIAGLRSDPIIPKGKCVIEVHAKQIKVPTYPPNCTCQIKDVKAHTSFVMKDILDLPHGHKTVMVDITRRRWKCKSKTCKKTVTQPLNIFAEDHYRMTRRLLEYCEVQALLRTELSLAEETGVDVRIIREIRKKYAKRLEGEIQFNTPRVLGLDGVRGDRHIRRIIFTNIEAGEVVDLIEGGKKEHIAARIKEFPNFGSIEMFTIDMCKTLLGAILIARPDAIIIIDVFHIVRIANQVMDKVRNRLFPREKKKREPGSLKRPRPEPFRKRRADLKDNAKNYMQFWFEREPELKLASDLKEAFMALFDKETYGGEAFMSADEARRRYKEWESSLPVEEKYSNLLTDFKPITSAMNNWGEYVFNRFDHNFTNAYTESMNRKVKDILRDSRGCDFKTLHAKIVFGTHLNKEIKADRKLEMEALRPRSNKRRRNGENSQRAVKSRKAWGGPSNRYETPNSIQGAFEFTN